MPSVPIEFSQVAWTFSTPITTETAVTTCAVGTPPSGWTSGALDNIRDAFALTFLTLMSADWKLARTVVYEGTSGGSVVHERVSNIAGSVSGSSGLPPNVAIIVKKHTGLSGRQNRGRMFIPGASEFSVDQAGRLGAGDIAPWNTECADFFTALVAMDAQPVLLHSTPAGGSGTPAPTMITGFTTDPVVGTQRRRVR